jgi:hypothetical protein
MTDYIIMLSICIEILAVAVYEGRRRWKRVKGNTECENNGRQRPYGATALTDRFLASV